MSADVMHDDMLAAAQDYAQAGMAVVWLAPGTKRPIAKGWQDAPRATPQELEATYRPGMNLGLRCGPVSVWGGAGSECLAVLDLDISTDDVAEHEAAWAAVRELIGYEMADAPSVVSGSGRGRHWYLSWPVAEIRANDSARVVLAKSEAKVVGSAKHAWQLEVLLAGAQVVANPSIHPDTGLMYEMVGGPHVAPVELVEAVRRHNNRDKLVQANGGSGSMAGADVSAELMARLMGGGAAGASVSVAQVQAGAGDGAGDAALMAELAKLSAFADIGMSGGPDDAPSLERMREALAVIPSSGGRDEWMRVVWAIRAHGYPEGEQVAREWSEGCPEKFNEKDFAGVWRAQSRGAAVAAGTLYHIARQHGWAGRVRGEMSAAQHAAPILATEAAGVSVAGGGQPMSYAAGAGSILPAGDITNGAAFAAQWRGRLLYVSASKRWMKWTGSNWTGCSNEEVNDCAKATAERLVQAALVGLKQNPDGVAQKQAFADAMSTFKGARRLEAMLHMARSEQGMHVDSLAVFDSNPWQLTCPNGVLDLRTGVLSKAESAMLVSKQTAVAYEVAAQCPRFMQFLHEVFQGDQAMIDFTQRQLGYCLTGDVSEEKMFYWYGHGANGKSVLGDVVGRLLGDYTVSIDPTLLKSTVNGSGNAASHQTARLLGARLAQMNEIAEGEKWDEARLKAITSRESLTAEIKFENPFEFRPTHKLIVRGNTKPLIRDNSHGTWRRIVLVGFGRQFEAHEQVPNLDAWLVTNEGPGILAWLVDGCLKWQQGRLQIPQKVISETAEYRADNDLIGQWLSECCDVRDWQAKTPKKTALSSYQRWCEDNGLRHPMSATMLTKKLDERGLRLDPGKRHYFGLNIKPYDHGPEV